MLHNNYAFYLLPNEIVWQYRHQNIYHSTENAVKISYREWLGKFQWYVSMNIDKFILHQRVVYDYGVRD